MWGTHMIWLIVAIVASISFVQIVRWVQHANGSVAVAGWVNYQLAGAFFVLPFILNQRSAIDWPVFVFGLITGTIYVFNFFLMSVLIRQIGTGLVAATATLAVIMPIIASIVLGDRWLPQAPGLLVSLIAMPMVATARTQLATTKPSTPRLVQVLCVTLFILAVGTENTLLKLARELGGRGFEASYLPALFLMPPIISTAAVLVLGIRPRMGDVVGGLTLGVFNIVSNYAMVLAVQALTGPVVFPLKQIGNVLGIALIGSLVWRERLNHRGRIGIGLCIIGTLLLALP